MASEGQGQIIVGGGDTVATRTFDRFGHIVPSPSFRKADIGGYVEYGVTRWLTVVAAPTAARMRTGASGSSFTGSDQSAFGARLGLYQTGTQVVSIQALVEPPIGARRDPSVEMAFGGVHAFATDVRLAFGQSFSVFEMHGFVDVEPGARLRGGGWPSEARIDAAVGIRPWPKNLVLIQAFASAAPGVGPLGPPTAYAKVQLSLVHDLSVVWSVQLGVVRTVAGRNAACEAGPFVAVWWRF